MALLHPEIVELDLVMEGVDQVLVVLDLLLQVALLLVVGDLDLPSLFEDLLV